MDSRVLSPGARRQLAELRRRCSANRREGPTVPVRTGQGAVDQSKQAAVEAAERRGTMTRMAVAAKKLDVHVGDRRGGTRPATQEEIDRQLDLLPGDGEG